MGKRPLLNRSQAIRPFGPGALLELKGKTLVHGLADEWMKNSKSNNLIERLEEAKVLEIKLQKLFKTDYFLQLPTAPSLFTPGVITAYKFPRWGSCPGKCKRLDDMEALVSDVAKNRNTYKCSTCKRELIPSRLIVTCEDGHLDDFPWRAWVHMGVNCNGDLTFNAKNRSGRLSEIKVSCSCGMYRNLDKSTDETHFRNLALDENFGLLFRCKGRRPWLGLNFQTNETCNNPFIPAQRGRTDLYFPVVFSSIAVPPFTSDWNRFINKHWMTFHTLYNTTGLQAVLDLTIKQLIDSEGYSSDNKQAIIDDVYAKLEFEKGLNLDELDLQEHREIRKVHKKPFYNKEFHVESVSPSKNDLITRVTQIHRLREVSVLYGFTRLNAIPLGKKFNLSSETGFRDQFGQMGIKVHPSVAFHNYTEGDEEEYANWLPCIEVRGEGIYIEFNSIKLQEWSELDEIEERVNLLKQKIASNLNSISDEMEINAQLIVAHTFSHMIMNRLVLKSGYSSASLREKIYQNEFDGKLITGIMIYTSSSDAGGTLGGLVNQGRWDILYPLIKGVQKDAKWCSSDPLCSRQDMISTGGINLSACHACLLVSETSCSLRNSLLDRVLLTGTIDDPSIGLLNFLNI